MSITELGAAGAFAILAFRELVAAYKSLKANGKPTGPLTFEKLKDSAMAEFRCSFHRDRDELRDLLRSIDRRLSRLEGVKHDR